MTEQKKLDPHSVDIDTNPSSNQEFSAVLAMRLSRRRALVSGASAAAVAGFGGLGLTACGNSDETVVVPPVAAKPTPTAKGSVNLGFTSIAKSLEDKVKLPVGYKFDVLYALGDPIKDGVTAWADDGSETGDSFAVRAGDQHDAMCFFGSKDDKWNSTVSNSGMLVINHEAITQQYLHPLAESLAEPRNENQVIKEMNAHGTSLLKLNKDASGKFVIDKASVLTRRVTLDTEMELTGPVKGSRFVVTQYDNTGTKARGALNTCGSGKTPWGTYLAGEENWAAYFRREAGDDTNPLRKAGEVALNKRYDINAGLPRNYNDFGWMTVTPAKAADSHRFVRWNAGIVGTSLTGEDDYRHEPNTFGYMVEIDPFNPTAKPKKRTWLGRIAHEGCWPSNPKAGEPLAFYMGDDSINEYIYKFVTKAVWDDADVGKGLAAGDKYLNEGTLYVARFNEDGSGAWIELTFGKNNLVSDAVSAFPFTSQAAVLVATRLAADAVKATKMDRPEWGCVNPLNGEVYITLTNNKERGTKTVVDAANPRSYTDVDGKKRSGNPHGHIIRFAETNSKADATSFKWDVYVFGAEAKADANINLSKLTDDNDFSSPDGLWFDPRGVLWIQTDDGAYTDVTNCMMLAAVTGKVGDGEAITVNGQKTYKGKNPEGDLRRFLVGPVDSEITGIDMTADGKAMFINIQHPGENGTAIKPSSHWPDSETTAASTKRPRSATIVITRTDGGVIGL